MPSTFSDLLRLEKQANGENDTTWGTKANTVLEMIEDAIAGRASVSMADANYTLTTVNSATDEARMAILNIASSVPLTANRNVVVPTSTKRYIVKNATSGGFSIVVKTTAGTGITIPNGRTLEVYCDATNVVVGGDWAQLVEIVDTSLNELVKFTTTASAVNEFTVANAATGAGPSLSATGGDTNIPATVAGKGTGHVVLGQATSTDVRLAADQPIADSSGNELLKFSKTASAVNELTVANAATGAGPILSASGETNVRMTLAGKGTGAVVLGQATSTDVRLAADQPIADSSGNELLKFSKAATAVNEFTVANAATGSHPVLSATGGDTDINFTITPKGAGTINLNGGVSGTAVATQAEMESAASTARVVSPGRQHLHPSAAKVWAMCGFTGTADASYSVSSLTDIGAGQVSVNFTTSFSSANYAVFATAKQTSTGAGDLFVAEVQGANQAAGSCLIDVRRSSDGALQDSTRVFFAAFGDQ